MMIGNLSKQLLRRSQFKEKNNMVKQSDLESEIDS